jgi:hypothetical protein
MPALCAAEVPGPSAVALSELFGARSRVPHTPAKHRRHGTAYHHRAAAINSTHREVHAAANPAAPQCRKSVPGSPSSRHQCPPSSDLKLAARSCHRPAFTLVALLRSLGIGANTAVFSVVNGIVLNPLPYREPERLIALATTSSRTPSCCTWDNLRQLDRVAPTARLGNGTDVGGGRRNIGEVSPNFLMRRGPPTVATLPVSTRDPVAIGSRCRVLVLAADSAARPSSGERRRRIAIRSSASGRFSSPRAGPCTR